MQPRLPIKFAHLSGFLAIFVLSALSLTFAAAEAGEGVAVSWPDGTTNSVLVEEARGAISFEASPASTQLRRIDVSQARIPATVINLKLDQFQPLRLEVVDLQGNLVKTLAEGLWAEGDHQMAWHHENEHDVVLETGTYLVRLTPTLGATEGLAMGR